MKKEITILGFVILAFLILTNFKGVDTSKLTNMNYLKLKYKIALDLIKEEIDK